MLMTQGFAQEIHLDGVTPTTNTTTNNIGSIRKDKTNFNINSNVSLKDILISNSSSRKVVKE